MPQRHLHDGAYDRRSDNSGTTAIAAYYDQTWLDYRLLWLNRRNLSIHFGYADQSTRSHAETLVNINRVLADRVAIHPGERVLDAGCGVGGSSMWLARECGAYVVGISTVASQIRLATRFAAQQKLTDRVHFEHGDYTAAPFGDGSFDVVWALESLCHAPHKSAFYLEAARLLRPGGRLVIAEYLRSARPMGAAGEVLLHDWLEGWAIPDLDTADEHRAGLAAAGFADSRFDDVTEHMRPSLRRLYRVTLCHYPLAALGRSLRIRSAVQHGNVTSSLRQYHALKEGLWLYAIASATKPIH